MSHCHLGLSCEKLCVHGIRINEQQCYFCEINHKINLLDSKISSLIDHKIRQIDENRKISKHMDMVDLSIKIQCDIREFFYKKIKELEKKQKFLETNSEKIQRLESEIDELERLVNAIKESYNSLCASSLRREPHKCPICDGTGKHAKVLPSMSPIYLDCKSCDGKGILWS
jgi:DNA repair exonuclease SbcCD ATPase subunit